MYFGIYEIIRCYKELKKMPINRCDFNILF